ncbi:cytochrome P450 71AU50-like [Corylus avellana]|uniref:cytochrome P450 71AU50-like n=1 Tax=Corylus avellana TaxID=13451 RepID=UPI00286D6091|nr:cytochrome P450 71AU50-like [Corylus avellana]
MPTMAWTWTIAAVLVMLIAYLLLEWAWKSSSNKKKLPPGPRGFPIFGSLHLLGELPHRDLHRLAQKHGPIIYLRLGLVPAIVVSSPQVAEQFLKAHDSVFASRPDLEAAKHITYEQKNLGFSPYGSYWRNMRKMCTLELLSSHKINSFKPMRKQELGLLIKFIQEAARDCASVDLSAKVSSLSADMSCRMVFGKKYMDKDLGERGFKGAIQEGMQLLATPNIGDYIPYIGALDLQGLTRRMKAISKIYDDFWEKIIDEHVQSKDENKTKDFVDVMLRFMGSQESEYRIERSNIKAIMLDMLAGSMDTSATAIEWALSELMKHPRVMKKVQKELEDVVGLERMVEESDLDSLEYLDMVLKETFRLHPVAPLLLPHEATEDCTINGFHIPRKSRVMINVWAIGRDPSVWSDAEKFFPERFVGSNIDVRGQDFQLIPFGSGRRACPGMQLDMLVGSMDTSATVIEWAFSELMKNPQVMKKLQKELEDVVGLERMEEESDLDGLEYLDVVLKETFRLHPIPLLLPHQNCTVNGFHIPQKSRVIVNIWAIGRDPSVWNDVEKFFLERFVRSNVNVRGRDFQLISFGSSRRGCPGMQLDLTAVRLVVAQLVHCFDWELPNNMQPNELDMTEEFGLTTPCKEGK